MTKIEIKESNIVKHVQTEDGGIRVDGTMHYGDFMLQCLRSTPGRGFTIEDMRARCRVIEIIESKSVGDVFEIEDHDAEVLKKCVSDNDGNWPIVHKDTVGFTDYIKSLSPNKKR